MALLDTYIGAGLKGVFKPEAEVVRLVVEGQALKSVSSLIIDAPKEHH